MTPTEKEHPSPFDAMAEGSMKKRNCNIMRRVAMSVIAVMIAWVMAPGARSWAGELAPIPLPPPQTDGGKPLMQALGLRATSRAFAPDPVPCISILLLAGFLLSLWMHPPGR